jgi:parallel beta-helix repeat protein
MSSDIQQVKAEPRTWYVDDDGGADFTRIQDAINTARVGDTIFVYNGTYHEQLFIYKSLTLIGENKYAAIVDGLGQGVAVRIQSGFPGTKLSGFTIRNHEIGIYIALFSDSNIITDIIISNNTLGDPYNWGGGIYLDHSSNNIIADNMILDTTHVGIWHDDSSHNLEVRNLIIQSDSLGLQTTNGIHLGSWSHDNLILNNTILKSLVGIYADQRAYNNTIAGNIIENLTSYECGINIWGPNNRIIGNTITGMSYVGIQLNSYSSDGLYGHPDECANNIVSENVISRCTFGINLILAAFSNTIVGNNVSNNGLGILISDSSNNSTVTENLVSNNDYGLLLFSSNNTRVYHNSFTGNTQQVLLSDSFNTSWDDGYPSGGNCWSDYTGVDFHSGPYQNEKGSDGIGDTHYTIDADNIDHYPLMEPWRLKATMDIQPDTLSLKSKSQWIILYIELPEGYDVADINVSTVMLNGTIPAEPSPTAIDDYDNDNVPDLMVKFNRTAVSELILSEGIKYGNVTLTITGKLDDGTVFDGSDIVRVRMPGDINCDGKVDARDVAPASLAFGSYIGHSRWNPDADENEDGKIDARDIALIARNFGKSYR